MSTTSVQDWWLLPRVYQSSLWFLVSSPHFMHSPWILSMPLLCCRNDLQCSRFGIQLKSLAKVKNGSCVFKNILILTTMTGAPAPQVLCSARWAHRTFLHTYQNSLYMTVIFISIPPLITLICLYWVSSCPSPGQIPRRKLSLGIVWFLQSILPKILLSTLCITHDSTPVMAQSFLECDEIE